MPKVIDKKTVEQITKLKEESNFSFVKIGEKLGLHSNTVSRIYKKNKNKPVQQETKRVEVLPAVIPSSIKTVADDRKRKLESIRDSMFVAIEEVGELIKDYTFRFEAEEMLEQVGLFTEEFVLNAKRETIINFKVKYGFDRFQQHELDWVSNAWCQFWNEVGCSEVEEKEAMGMLSYAFDNRESLIEEVGGLERRKSQLMRDVVLIEEKRREMFQEIKKLEEDVDKMEAFRLAKAGQLLRT